MTTVIQIFKSVRIFQKPDYTPETRKELGEWPDSIKSSSGYEKKIFFFFLRLWMGKRELNRINGKSDFTLSGRKQRHYHEFKYVMELIGGYNRVEFLSPLDISCKKSIPVKQVKGIDERKAPLS